MVTVDSWYDFFTFRSFFICTNSLQKGVFTLKSSFQSVTLKNRTEIEHILLQKGAHVCSCIALQHGVSVPANKMKIAVKLFDELRFSHHKAIDIFVASDFPHHPTETVLVRSTIFTIKAISTDNASMSFTPIFWC